MALKTTVRMGGDSGATVVDYTSEIPLWKLNEDGEHESIFDTGMKCDNGNACQYQFTIINDLGDIPRANLTKNLPAFTRVTITEDAPGYEAALSYGRIARKEIDRGDHPWGDSRTFRVTVNDANFDLTDLDLVAPWERPSESGRTRVLAAITAFLSGSPRLTTDIENHLVAAGGEVTMPAHTYPAGTTMVEILNDCATVEGKFYNVAIHHDAGASHLCFQYQDENDHTNFASTITITDDDPDLVTEFPPMWDQGPASLEDGDVDPISHLVSRYGVGDDSYYVASDASRVTSYDYRSRSYNDSKSETAGQAADRAEAVLSAKGREHVSHQVTIQLRADQVDLLCAGMSIDIQSAASMGGQYLGTVQTRRIAELKWEPIAPDVGAVPGFYLAHMQLDRAVRLLPEGKGGPVGPKPPNPGGSAPVVAATDGFIRSLVTSISIALDIPGTDTAIYAVVQNGGGTVSDVTWRQGVDTGTDEDFTYLGRAGTAGDGLEVWRLLNPTNDGDRNVVSSCDGYVHAVHAWALSGVDQSNPNGTIATSNSTGTVSAVSPSGGDLVLNAASMWEDGVGGLSAAPTPGGGQTEDAAYIVDAAGNISGNLGAGHGSNAPTWTFDFSGDWLAVGIPINSSNPGDTTSPIGGGGDADPGSDTDVYAPIDHVHEHDDQSDHDDETHHAAASIEYDNTTSGLTADDVQAAIDELAAESGSSDHGALTGLADDDHPQYLTEDEGASSSIPLNPFDVHDLIRGYNLTKQGIVIERGASSSWKESLVESPNVFWSPEAGKYVMVFVGYSGTPASPTEGALGVATADSPDGPWTEYATNPFFEKSGAGDDSHGTSGPFVWYEDGTYHLFYIGLTASGYEAGTKTICHATSTDWIPGTNDGTWTRNGAVIEPDGSGWRSTSIWHPNIVKRGSTYYLFFNATGAPSAKERIGYATSTDLSTWTVDDANSPVLTLGSGGAWDDDLVGDPYVYRVGETWYMAYFGYDGTNAQDGLAFTSDADFPLGWTKFGDNPVLTYGGSDDSKHAHKPSIWITPTKHYHWYTAVTTASPEKREIALATEEVSGLGASDHGGLSGLADDDHTHYLTEARHDALDHSALGHYELLMTGSSPPEPLEDGTGDDWLYVWVNP